MSGRLAGKVAIVVGAGQTPGDTIGNGRATAVLFAREGARVVAVDRRLDSAEETVAQIHGEGGEAEAFAADATREADCAALVADCVQRYGRIDVLHNNVGIGGGDAGPAHVTEEAWDRILAREPQERVFPCKHVLPVMREQKGGAIINVSSIAAVCSTPAVAYKTSKAGINAYTQSLALGNAKYGIRANVIMPGPDGDADGDRGHLARRSASPKEKLIAQRNAAVPLGGNMGTAWDVAWAAVFLASDEARFITGRDAAGRRRAERAHRLNKAGGMR